jgi:site-specific DNA-methyltransferase (adenine-specific)
LTVEIIQGDCLSVMAGMADGSVDMILTDLPYEATQNEWDKKIPFEPMWAHFWRLCPAGAVVLTAMQPFSSALTMSQERAFKHEWVWEKNKASGHLNAKKAPMRAHEVALVFAQGACPYYPQMTDGHAPGNYAVRRTYTPNYGAQTPTEYGGSTLRYPRSVQKFPVVNNDSPERGHSTQKPVDLFAYLIETYSQPGQLVLDCCAGSGTTGAAALTTGRRAVLIEKHPPFVEFAKRRLGLTEPSAMTTDILG